MKEVDEEEVEGLFYIFLDGIPLILLLLFQGLSLLLRFYYFYYYL